MPHTPLFGRRDFLRSAAGTRQTLGVLADRSSAIDARPPKVAAVVTEFTYRSHAHVHHRKLSGAVPLSTAKSDRSRMGVVSLYVDQFPAKRDMAREVAKVYQHPDLRDHRRGRLPRRKRSGRGCGALDRRTGQIPDQAKGQREFPASDSSTRSSPCPPKRSGRSCRSSTTSTCRTAGTGPRRCTTRPATEDPAHGGQLGAAGRRRPPLEIAAGGRDRRRSRSTAGRWRATTSTGWKSCSRSSNRGRRRDGRGRGSFYRNRRAAESVRCRQMVA